MSNALHAKRLTLALLVTLALAACSGPEAIDPESAAADRGGDSSGLASSSAGLPAGRISVGEQLVMAQGEATGQSCADCHGADGNGPIDPSYPKLGGQYADYLAHALKAYRSGNRQHALMTGQAARLSDQDIADLAAYFGSRETQLRNLHGVD
jgi:cytochrome c553